jgi:hypothetical protein
MAGTKPITHSLRNQEESRCIVWGGATEKQSRLVRGAHASMAGQQHTCDHRGQTLGTKWQAASQSLTSCRIRRDPDALCGAGGQKAKQARLVRGIHASMAGQQHKCEHSGHISSTIWQAASQSLTSCRIRRDPDPRAGLRVEKKAG